MKEINGRRERSPLRRWVLIQELALAWDGGGCKEGVGVGVVRKVGGGDGGMGT